jgi:fermentation-respiration switch protein FrsA (DUF1100 family)
MIFLLALFVLLLLFAGVALLLQRRLMFPAPEGAWPDLTANVAGLERWRLGGEGEAGVEALYLPPAPLLGSPGLGEPAPAVIFAHGNGELADFWAEPFQEVREWGMAVLLVEFPGYGRSGGKPSQRSITEAMVAAYDALAARPEVDSSRIVGHGRSMGGGAICALAERRQLVALVLESTFTGIRPLALRMGVPGFLVLDPFDNLVVVSRFEGPILLLHGRRDGIIPPSHAERLQAAAKDSTLHWLSCGHNDCPPAWPWIKPFLEERGILRR